MARGTSVAHAWCLLPGYDEKAEGETLVTERLLRLYIAGHSATSRRAEKNLIYLRSFLRPEWHVEVVDVLKNPELADHAGILATPTLSYEHPERPRRVIGDLSDTKRVLEFLGIEPKGNIS
jgi:circadian clock protein KaiB